MHDAEILVQVLILGLANGALFSLIALGYTLVYGIIELINFAHGEVYMIGTFVALTVVLQFGLTRSSTSSRSSAWSSGAATSSPSS